MNTTLSSEKQKRYSTTENLRSQLLDGLPVTEKRMELAGVSTAVLEGGDGKPILLLHGPGESAVNWRWVIPGLVTGYRVIAPDLPAHGSSDVSRGEIDTDLMIAWLSQLIDETCSSSPVVVGHAVGGAIAARFAVDHSERLDRLVLVDALGLAPFRPTPRFALTMFGFLMKPTERTYERFMRQCAFDLNDLREQMGEDWEPFEAYNISLARSPKAKVAGQLLRKVGLPRIPPAELARITVSTTLIWGRHDRANRLRVAEAARNRYGWALHIVEHAADDPPRDQPEAFLQALRHTLKT